MPQTEAPLEEVSIPEEGSSSVCVAGMHRSRTSTVAQLLYRAGLHLGDEGDLMAGNRANSDGYWENERFVEINDAILKEHGGGWDLPPVFPLGWERAEGMQPYRMSARRLIGSLKQGAARGDV